MSVHKNLKYYYTILSRSNKKILCPVCKISTLPKLFEKHCLAKHNIDGKLCCVWCRQVFWAIGEKYKHANHLKDCFKKFINKKTITSKSFRLLSLDHRFTEKDFYGHDLASPVSLDPVRPLDVDPLPPVHFPDENLNLAASYILKYLETRDTHDWLHVMVKICAYESFVRAMNEGSSNTLLFSCWCDGGTNENDQFRQHKHLIVVSSPKGHFAKAFCQNPEGPKSESWENHPIEIFFAKNQNIF